MKKLILFISILLCSFTISAKQHPQLEDVIEYVDEIQKSVDLFIPLLMINDDDVVREFTQFMNDLAKRGQVFGTSSLDEPFGWCAMMGNSARDYWQSFAMARASATDNSDRIKGWLDMHIQTEENCLSVIESGGEIASKEPVCDENGKCLTPTIIDLN